MSFVGFYRRRPRRFFRIGGQTPEAATTSSINAITSVANAINSLSAYGVNIPASNLVSAVKWIYSNSNSGNNKEVKEVKEVEVTPIILQQVGHALQNNRDLISKTLNTQGRLAVEALGLRAPVAVANYLVPLLPDSTFTDRIFRYFIEAVVDFVIGKIANRFDEFAGATLTHLDAASIQLQKGIMPAVPIPPKLAGYYYNRKIYVKRY